MRLPLLLLLLAAFTARAELRVFEPRHALPESLLPAVQPLLEAHESVTVYRNTLVVDAGSGTLTRVEQLIRELDRPLRNLRISLRRRGSSEAGAAGVGIEGTAQAGDVRVTTTRPAGSGLTVRTEQHVETRAREDGQSLRALEGSRVAIRDGQLVALGLGGRWGPRLGYTELEQGFAVTARLSGERVILDVEVADDRAEGGAIRTGSLNTRIGGALGEWIWLGGAQRGESARIDGATTRYGTHARSEDQYEIRVELSP